MTVLMAGTQFTCCTDVAFLRVIAMRLYMEEDPIRSPTQALCKTGRNATSAPSGEK
jgi:hypothetical protein